MFSFVTFLPMSDIHRESFNKLSFLEHKILMNIQPGSIYVDTFLQTWFQLYLATRYSYATYL